MMLVGSTKVFFAVSGDSHLYQYDLATSKTIEVFAAAERITAFAIREGDQLAATAAWENSIHLSDLATGSARNVLTGHTRMIRGVAFADGELLVSASEDRTCKLWEVATGKLIASVEASESHLTNLAVVPEASTVITGDGEGRVQFWSLPKLTQRAVVQAHEGAGIHHLVVSKRGDRMVSCCSRWSKNGGLNDGEIAIWNLHLPTERKDGP
jgi:WD40 repeat protein